MPRPFPLPAPASASCGTCLLYTSLKDTWKIGVIEGDIAGQIDAERIAALGVPAVQLNTDGACHIEAMSIQHILPSLPLDDLDVIFVENIGNLVCPAEFNIGESLRITLLSIPEGDDKVEKYPLMFTDTNCLVLSKSDMLPYFDFDMSRVFSNYRTLNPDAPLFCVNSRNGDGLDELVPVSYTHLPPRYAILSCPFSCRNRTTS